MTEEPSLLLVTLSGPNRPEISERITGLLARYQVSLQDTSQAVVQNVISWFFALAVLPEEGQQQEFLAELKSEAASLGLALAQKLVSGATAVPARRSHYAITLLGDPVHAVALHEVIAALGRHGLTVDQMKRLSDGGFGCLELLGSAPAGALDQQRLKGQLLAIARRQGVDIALQEEGLYRRAKRLIVLDLDSTLIQSEVIDELAREKGAYDEVAAITHRAMAGEMDFDESLRQRVSKLRGLKLQHLDKVFGRLELTPGADELIHVLKKLGYRVGIISGGFTFVVDRLKERLAIDYGYANTLEIRQGELTGNVIPPIVNAKRKAELLESIAQRESIELDQVIAIGDGANDILMLEKAGLGIAFNAKPAVNAHADLALTQKNLRSILYLLGLSGEELNRAGLAFRSAP